MADDNPDTFALVTIHHGDGLATPWGNQRAIFYDSMFIGYPTFVYDGLFDAWPPGTYISKFRNRQLVPTDVTIELTGVQLAENEFEVTADICIEPGGVAKDMRIHMVEVLDHHPAAEAFHRNTLRQGASSEDVSAAANECLQVVRSFTFDSFSMSHPRDIQIIAWAQDTLNAGPSEVFQAAKHRPYTPEVFADGFESGDLTAWSLAVE